MLYVCTKQFTDVHYKVTIKVGHTVYLNKTSFDINGVEVSNLFNGTIRYPAVFFFGHFRPAHELRELKLKLLGIM
jgi:hypothetical protein